MHMLQQLWRCGAMSAVWVPGKSGTPCMEARRGSPSTALRGSAGCT